MGISSVLKVEFQLGKAVSTDRKVAGTLSMLVDTSVLVCRVVDISSDGITSLSYIRRLHKFGLFVTAVASTIIVIVILEFSVKCCIGVKSKPSLISYFLFLYYQVQIQDL